jgi:3-hydroxyisobutyrate dehydrogenase-like beta-hydroxyacid dehydrogenase
MGQVLGFVGVGRMGGPMASRLLDAGLVVRMRHEHRGDETLAARGATVAASARRGLNGEVVFMSCRRPVSSGSVAR